MENRWKRAGLILGAAILLGLLEAAQGRPLLSSIPSTQYWPEALLRTMPSWFLLAALVPAVSAFAKRFRLDGPRRVPNLVLHVAAGFAFVAVHLGGSAWFAAARHDALYEYGRYFLQFLYRNVAADYTLYWALICALHVWWHQREIREREVAESRLRAQLAEARLGALRAQLHPHFLFNTLNAISTLALRGDRERLLGALDSLCVLLRASLEDEGGSWKTLAEEMSFVDRYLEIQSLRFGDRLVIERDVPESTLAARVPNLLLQPIVENAIEHGLSRRPGEGLVAIRARREDLVLVLEVHDRGPGFAATAADATAGARVTEPRRAGVGLANTRERLAQLFGARAALECGDAEGGGARVRIRLPWIETAAEAVAARPGSATR